MAGNLLSRLLLRVFGCLNDTGRWDERSTRPGLKITEGIKDQGRKRGKALWPRTIGSVWDLPCGVRCVMCVPTRVGLQ